MTGMGRIHTYVVWSKNKVIVLIDVYYIIFSDSLVPS